MDTEVKENGQVSKRQHLITLSEKAHLNVLREQDRFQKRTGGRISMKAAMNKILETGRMK